MRTPRGCYGCWGHIRAVTAVPPLPCDHTVRRNAMLFRYLLSVEIAEIDKY